MPKVLYAQSGGVTPVINSTAAGVIAATQKSSQLSGVLVAADGILGVLEERLYDCSGMDEEGLNWLREMPGGAFGSCRLKLPNLTEGSDAAQQEAQRLYQRLLDVLVQHDVGLLLYNGGGDSMDTADKLHRLAKQSSLPIEIMGLPKTIDNDLFGTDTCPGFGSVARYVAISTLEASLDVRSMASTSTQVFVLEVMGRHAGWIAAAASMAFDDAAPSPLTILLPERPVSQQAVIQRVEQSVAACGYAVVVVSEGAKDLQGPPEAADDTASRDSFGHLQLGGLAPALAQQITKSTGRKCHWGVADYLQRSARHLASDIDLGLAELAGRSAVEWYASGRSGNMVSLQRRSQAAGDSLADWQAEPFPLEQAANRERGLPDEYMTADGMGITPKGRQYLQAFLTPAPAPAYARENLTTALPPDFLNSRWAQMVPPLLPKWLPK